MQKEIINKLEEIFKRVIEDKSIVLNETSTADDIEGWDSLTHAIILDETQKVFNISFSFREMMKLKNVGDLCDLIIYKTDN